MHVGGNASWSPHCLQIYSGSGELSVKCWKDLFVCLFGFFFGCHFGLFVVSFLLFASVIGKWHFSSNFSSADIANHNIAIFPFSKKSYSGRGEVSQNFFFFNCKRAQGFLMHFSVDFPSAAIYV